MKALFIDEPGKASLGEVPEPEIEANEVLLRIHTVGFCGSDLATFRGLNPLVGYPRIPGHEIGATIAKLGTYVPSQFEVGMPVTLSPYTACGVCSSCQIGRTNCCKDNQTLGVQRNGIMTPYARIGWEKLFTAEKLTMSEFALVEPLTIGFHAIDRGQVTEADTVAIFGAGAIGLGAISGAAARNARVISIDIDNGKLELARKLGASETINTQTEDLHVRLQELTDGHGPQVIVEAVGSPITYRASVDEVAFAGRVVCIGYAKTPVEYETKFFVMKELDIRGSRNAMPSDFKSVIAMLERGDFPTSEVVTQTVPLEEAAAALKAWDDDPSSVTKIHVEIG